LTSQDTYGIMARTIDNLGIEPSTRYAEDQATFDKSLVRDTRVQLDAKIDVTEISYTSEIDQLFELEKRHGSWSQFVAPEGYYQQQGKLFTNLVVPALGTLDKREGQLQKISQMEMGGNEHFSYEKQILINLFKNLQTLDESLIDINDNRAQYQKG